MKVRQAIELARGLKQIDQVNYPDLLMLQFLNECEGKLQTEFLHIADVDCQRYTENDMEMDLIVGPPHDKLYYAYLCAMIDFTNGEYAKYNNSIIVANAFMAEWAAWFNRTHERDGRQYLGVFLSAYGIAVKHGYAGTEEEWLESLEGPAGPQGIQGEPGPQGAPGTVSFDKLTEEQLAMLIGPEGKQGVPGTDGQDGVGIQSVEQTTTSTEDGGTNVVTVTKTDGTTSTFYVRNGSRGSTGPAGSDGQDGVDGKSAYQYAVEGGYTGTEEAFAAKLAAEKFVNPNALTFTGAVTGSYDGSVPLEVEIPSGGGGITVTNTAAVGQTIKVSAVDETGQPTEWEAVDIAEQVQADWNQNDETRNDYVKNRPFYLKDARETKIFELAFTVQTGLSYEKFDGTNLGLEAGKEYTVNIMGQEFKATAYVYKDGVVCIGDGDAAYNGTTDFRGNVPFGVGDFAFDGYAIVLSLPYLAESGLVSGVTDEIPVNIISEIQEVVPIDSKFLPKATLTSIGVISKYQVRNEIFTNDLLNVSVNETTYKRLLEYLSNHVFSVIHCIDSNISSNGVSLFVTNYETIISEKGVVRVNGNSINGGNINGIDVVFPLNSDGSGIDDGALAESISPIIPNYILLGNNDKKFKITVDDSGTISATEVIS